MKNYSEISDFEINKAVATLQGYDTDVTQHFGDAGLSTVKTTEGRVNYCNSWSDAGPIIEQCRITLDSDFDVWFARDDNHCHTHANPLRAAMIVFLMMQESKGE